MLPRGRAAGPPVPRGLVSRCSRGAAGIPSIGSRRSAKLWRARSRLLIKSAEHALQLEKQCAADGHHPARREAQPPRRSPMLTATSSREEQWGHLIDADAEPAEPPPPSDSELSEPISIVSDHARTSPTMPSMDECEEDCDSPRSFTVAKPQPPSSRPKSGWKRRGQCSGSGVREDAERLSAWSAPENGGGQEELDEESGAVWWERGGASFEAPGCGQGGAVEAAPQALLGQ